MAKTEENHARHPSDAVAASRLRFRIAHPSAAVAAFRLRFRFALGHPSAAVAAFRLRFRIALLSAAARAFRQRFQISQLAGQSLQEIFDLTCNQVVSIIVSSSARLTHLYLPEAYH
jgi:hypothetical protein